MPKVARFLHRVTDLTLENKDGVDSVCAHRARWYSGVPFAQVPSFSERVANCFGAFPAHAGNAHGEGRREVGRGRARGFREFTKYSRRRA